MDHIEKAEIYPIALPLNHPYKSATRTATHSQDVVVKLITSDGAAGWGAAALRPYPTGESLASAVKVLDEYLVPVVQGKNPFDREKILHKMDAAIAFHHSPKAAVDCALHDLIGRLLGCPVYDLLGGKVRDEMPSFDILPLESPERTTELAAEAAGAGVTALKVKMNRDVRTSVARVSAARRALGDEATLVVDANMSWTPKLAVQVCAKIEEFDIAMVEQPVPGNDLDGLEFVTKNTRVPICADESMRPGLYRGAGAPKGGGHREHQGEPRRRLVELQESRRSGRDPRDGRPLRQRGPQRFERRGLRALFRLDPVRRLQRIRKSARLA